MNANSILTANVLDIIFDGKNKEYGAYELRKSYSKRIVTALIITFLALSLFIIGSLLAKKIPQGKTIPGEITGIVISKIAPVDPPPPPILPPPPVMHAATISFPPPMIVKDNLVITPPPEIKELLAARIDIKNSDGLKDVDIINPPEEIKGSAIFATPVEKKKEDSTYYKVEIDASFPGGNEAWTKYVSNAIERDKDEFSEADYGTCIVKFIVDKTGKVSHVEAINMKGTKLAEIAVNAIRKGPDWIPAIQNGSNVNAYRLQPVTFDRIEQ